MKKIDDNNKVKLERGKFISIAIINERETKTKLILCFC